MLDQCDAVIGKIRKNAASQGTSVALTYLLVALTQSIDRLRKLLFLVDVSGDLPSAPTVDLVAAANDATPPAAPPTSLRRAGAITLAQELVEAHNAKYEAAAACWPTISTCWRATSPKTPAAPANTTSPKRRAELRYMFLSSAGAGVVVGFMALFKILLGYLRSAPLVEAFLFSMNYSLGFMLIHVMHLTIATKQPAMTAARIAAGLSSKDGRHIDLDNMAELINKVFRTQCVAVLGNLATVIPARLGHRHAVAQGDRRPPGHARQGAAPAARHRPDPQPGAAVRGDRRRLPVRRRPDLRLLRQQGAVHPHGAAGRASCAASAACSASRAWTGWRSTWKTTWAA